jgi:DNA-binding transcriptional ArsR family regulator
MVKYRETSLDRVFHALADPTRRHILSQLAGGDRTVSEVSNPLPMSMPAVTKHLNVLEEAGLLKRTKDGRLRHCRLQASPLMQASDWLDYYREFWNTKLDNLEEYLNQQPEEK